MILQPALAFDPPPFNDPERERQWFRESVARVDRFLNNPQYEEYWQQHNKRQVRADWVNLLSLLPRLSQTMIFFDLERMERIERSRAGGARSAATRASTTAEGGWASRTRRRGPGGRPEESAVILEPSDAPADFLSMPDVTAR